MPLYCSKMSIMSCSREIILPISRHFLYCKWRKLGGGWGARNDTSKHLEVQRSVQWSKYTKNLFIIQTIKMCWGLFLNNWQLYLNQDCLSRVFLVDVMALPGLSVLVYQPNLCAQGDVRTKVAWFKDHNTFAMTSKFLDILGYLSIEGGIGILNPYTM